MKLADDLSNLDEFLKKFDRELTHIHGDVRLDGINIERACMEQAAYTARYDELAVELAYAIRKVEVELGVIKMKVIDRIERKAQKAYGSQMLEKMAEADPVYVKYNLAAIELKERYERAELAVKALDKRGFALANIVKININQLRDITIHGYDD